GAARLRRDGVDAGRARGDDQELRGFAGDERSVSAGVTVGDLPVAASQLLQGNGWAGERVEAPLALDRAGQPDGCRLRFDGFGSFVVGFLSAASCGLVVEGVVDGDVVLGVALE